MVKVTLTKQQLQYFMQKYAYEKKEDFMQFLAREFLLQGYLLEEVIITQDRMREIFYN